MKKKSVLFCLLVGGFLNAINAQVTVSGKVTDANSKAVPRASIHVLNTNAGVVSSTDGSFSIGNVLPGNYIIEFSAIGYANRSLQVQVGKEPVTINSILLQKINSLDEVVVTAQKREEMLQRLPVSITALTSQKVEEYRLWNSKDLTAIAPNFYSSDPGDKRNVTSIRGIATTSYDPAVATYIDGVNQFSLDTYIASLFDIERIEVLRGPQGTLYGRNAMGGVINIITRQPTNATNGFVEASIGNYGSQRYSAGIRTPLIKDKLFFGAAGLYDRSNGYFTNEFNNSHYDKQHNVMGNYYLKYLMSPKWAATLNLKHNSNRNNGPFPLVLGVDDAFANPYKVNQNGLTTIIDNSLNTSLSLNYTGRGFNFNSQTAYQSNYRYYNRPIDADFSPADIITLINNYGKDWNNVKVLTQEFKFSSAAGSSAPLKWTAGTFLFHQSSPTKQNTSYGADAGLYGATPGDATINTTEAKGSGIAFYGQAIYSLTDRLDLTAGLRYDYEHKEQSVFGQYQQGTNPPITLRSDTSGSANFNAFTPKLSLAYRASESNLLFAGYSRGYRAGGFTPYSGMDNQPPLVAFKPEYSNNIEAGIKSTLVRNKLSINLTGFYTTVTDAQVPTLVLPSALTITRNTGKLTSKGVEAEINAAPAKGLEVNYSVGYTHATYDDLKVSQGNTEADFKGNRQIFTPDITSMLAAQYSVGICKNDKVKLVVRGEWKYLGTQYFDLANTIRQAPYQLLNTRAGFSTDWFDLMFWARNITDKKFMAYAYDFGGIHLGDPKTYGVSLKVKF
jgi:iron complex outermembrane receptor protein